MDKLLEFEERFPKTGEPTVQLVAFDNLRGGLTIEKRAFAESSSPIYDFLKTVQPEAGCSFILVNALGAYEYYDDNRNGDGFPAQPYKVGQLATCGHAECSKSMEGWVSEPETLIHHYPSFEKHGGIYKHHVNKDPTKSLGYIQKAVWNHHMRRVELLLKLVNSRDPQMAQRIGDGDFPAVSMGCHVRWDVCTICGHHAPTRAQYCEHASRSLRKVLPDGRKVAVLNPSPKFFDISFVFRPADPTGWMLKKVAEHGGPFQSSSELGESLRSHESRAYEIRSGVAKVAQELATPYGRAAAEIVSEWPVMSESVKEVLASVGAKAALTSLAYAGVPLSTGEVIGLFSKCANLRPSVDDVDRLVALEPVLTEIVARYPSLEEKLGAFVAPSLDDVKPAVLRKLAGWVEKRGGILDFLKQKAYAPSDFDLPFGPGAEYRAYEPAKTDLLTMTHPMTGEQYQTTRGAAMEAANQDAKASLIGTALMGTLYAGGLRKVFGPDASLVTVPLGIGAGYLTQKKLREMDPVYRNPYYMTDQGIPVSGGTPFVKASEARRPSATDVLHKAAFDHVERTGQASYEALLQKIANAGGSRYASWLAATPLSEKVAALVSGAEMSDAESGLTPTINITALVNNINRRVWR
jgi:hypothetical protein